VEFRDGIYAYNVNSINKGADDNLSGEIGELKMCFSDAKYESTLMELCKNNS
jgi:hypothetical protein